MPDSSPELRRESHPICDETLDDLSSVPCFDPDTTRVERIGDIIRITRRYREGFAAQMLGSKWGFIDIHGHLAIKRRFDSCFDFSEGLAAVKIGEKWTFVNPLGARIHEPSFVEVTSFVGGFARVRVGEEWKFLTKQGQVIDAMPEPGRVAHGNREVGDWISGVVDDATDLLKNALIFFGVVLGGLFAIYMLVQFIEWCL